jgi:glycosyltransferase involved in cell wall biosynthesis
VARKLPAIKLIYGDSAQLKSTLDVLIRQLIAAKPSHGDLCVLCEAFTAKAQSDFISRRPASASAPASITKAIVEPNAMLPKTEARFPRRLSIGMATYDDYDGAYFTIQSIRAQNPDLSAQLEFIVVDNNPTGVCARALKDLEKTVDGYRYIPRGDWSGTAIKNAVFEEASSEFVLCLDSHVLLVPGAIAKLLDYMESGRAQRDLLQGPLLDDDLQKISTHFDPIWRGGMYGVWGTDPRGLDVDAEPFDIPMQGMGLFACSRDAWPRFNPAFRGFGGEEGYIHEKVRQLGGRSICLPFLRWVHRFNRPLGVPYRNTWEDRIRNYYLGFNELGLNTADMETHFQQLLGKGVSDKIVADIKAEMSGAGALDVLSMAQDVRKIAHR